MLDAPSQMGDREPQSEQMPPFIPPYLDANADLSSLHYPELEGGKWFPYTQEHFMVELKLTPCARLLYHYVLTKAPAGCFVEINLHDFRAVTSENHRGKPYSMRQIRNAVNELEKLQLVVTKSESVKMQARHPGSVTNISPRQQKADGKLTSTSGKLTSTSRKLISTPEKLTSKSSLETPVEQGFPVPTDLYRSDQITHIAAPADATPAPHPDVYVLSEKEEEAQPTTSEAAEVRADQDPGSVEELIKDLAQSKDLIRGTIPAASEKPKKSKNTQSARIKWECLGTDEEKLEFLKWKGSLLVNAGKTSKAEAESAALGWANKHPEEATLAYDGWKREINQEQTPTSKTSHSVLLTAPSFETMTSSEHEALVRACVVEGEEAFKAREVWHSDWLKFAKQYLNRVFKKVEQETP